MSSISPHDPAEKTSPKARSDIEISHDAIAIVGMACRYPGDVESSTEFWDFLKEGKDAIRQFPEARLSSRLRLHQPGGYLESVDEFDAAFFGISPTEARSMDPQQRLLLEVGWEALEDMGSIPKRDANSPTGVFIGITANDYARILSRNSGGESVDPYFTTGAHLNAAAGRLSYFLGLRGPSLALDTACSSSLVAVHLACQSIRNRECEQALAGGVNLILSPEINRAASQSGMLSKDGHCRTFDEAADGLGRSEGCGVIILKRLSKAIEDDDTILATIKGSAVNHDGATAGFTVPSKKAQIEVIQSALSDARLTASDISYIEAHGTGTPLGDPLEISALGVIAGERGEASAPLLVGSVKSNIGHLESAAGIAGLMKIVLAMQAEELPPNLHFNNPSSKIAWNQNPLSVVDRLTPWKSNGHPLYAGVSSFGASGTNAHVILQQAPKATTRSVDDKPMNVSGETSLFTLSAKSAPALQALVKRHSCALNASGSQEIRQRCVTANTGRMHFSHRLAVLAKDRTSLIEELALFRNGHASPRFKTDEVAPGADPEVVFMFTGQGSQIANRGLELFESQPIFRRAIEECQQILGETLDHSLLDVMFPRRSGGDESLINSTAYAQPSIFALQYGLLRLWQSWGIEPQALIGHSVGEYVAAVAAGIFTLEDGLRLVVKRGQLMASVPHGRGAMLAILSDKDEVMASISTYGSRVSLAAVNGPSRFVISGDTLLIEEIEITLNEKEVPCQRLNVASAFHSAQMDSILDEFEKHADGVRFSKPSLPIISTVTGAFETSSMCRPGYWRDQIRKPVLFAPGIKTLAADSYHLFLEIGPDTTLCNLSNQCLTANSSIPSFRNGKPENHSLLESLAELYTAGLPIDWHGVHANDSKKRCILPSYPFQRVRYWPVEEPPQIRESCSKFVRLPAIGLRPHEHVWQAEVNTISLPNLLDHRLDGVINIPAGVLLELILSAVRDFAGSDASYDLESVKYSQMIFLGDEDTRMIQIALSGMKGRELAVTINSRAGAGNQPWVENGTARAAPRVQPADNQPQSDHQ